MAYTLYVQKHEATEIPSPISRPVSRQCAINARNALTVLFTSSIGSGQLPTQPNSQREVKAPSKATARAPKSPPSLRRSSRLKT